MLCVFFLNEKNCVSIIHNLKQEEKLDDFQMCYSNENIFVNLIVMLSLLNSDYYHVLILSFIY